MKGTLIYLPLEEYVERYTQLMSCKDGWAETHFKNLGVDFIRVDGTKQSGTINSGSVVDAYGRSRFAMSQITQVLNMIELGSITNADTIYCEDFWHPGIESLFYVRQLTGMTFKIACFLHAQTADIYDFTYPMREWMSPIELGYSRGYDFIFVCSDILKELLVEDIGFSPEKIHVVGLPYNGSRLRTQLTYMDYVAPKRKPNTVLFSSRFDDEKNPHFFMDLVEKCPDINFRLVNPRKVISNNVKVRERLTHLLLTQDNIELIDTSKSKVKYYEALASSEVQFNCALQDWVSWTLIEGIDFGCKPLYPMWRDFPLELKGNDRYLYHANDLEDASTKLYALLANKKVVDPLLQSVVNKHNNTWAQFINILS